MIKKKELPRSHSSEQEAFTVGLMPFVVRSDSENEAELVFLSPEEDPPARPEPKDQGASPVLRRSNRKRKSVTCGSDMSKSSGSKKKKTASPDPTKSMPKLPRTPQGGQEDKDEGGGKRDSGAAAFEAMLLAMEKRLGAKMERATEAAQEAVNLSKQTKDNLERLEAKVDRNEDNISSALLDTEGRLMDRVDTRVKEMVETQLRASGFDPELTAADMPMRESAVQPQTAPQRFYANALSTGASITERTSVAAQSREDRQEANFWVARRSLRLWPIPGGERGQLEEYLKTKLRMDAAFLKDELGDTTITRTKEPKNKNKDEYIVTFESKYIRDAVKAAATNLANFRETAGMRLHIPDHLQRDFRTLMNLSYDLKKRHKELRRNIKFDEEDKGLFMDIKMDEGAEWRRIKPENAAAAAKRRNKTKDLDAEDLRSLLGSGDESK